MIFDHPETRWFPLTKEQHEAVLAWRGENHIYSDWDAGYERLVPIPPESHNEPQPQWDKGREWRFRKISA